VQKEFTLQKTNNQLIKEIEENNPQRIIASFLMANLQSDHIKQLAQALIKNCHLKILDLRDSGIRPEHLPMIERALAENQHIIKCQLEQFQDDSEETRALHRKIQDHIARNEKVDDKGKSNICSTLPSKYKN